MDPAYDERRKRSGFGTVLAILFGVLLLYVLSIGPARRLVNNGHISVETADKVNFPVMWIYHRSETFKSVLDWYGRLWY